jgi:hypothetical protein
MTRLVGSGRYAPEVSVLLTIVPRKEPSGGPLSVLHRDHLDLIFAVEDVRMVHERAPSTGEVKPWESNWRPEGEDFTGMTLVGSSAAVFPCSSSLLRHFAVVSAFSCPIL